MELTKSALVKGKVCALLYLTIKDIVWRFTVLTEPSVLLFCFWNLVGFCIDFPI